MAFSEIPRAGVIEMKSYRLSNTKTLVLTDNEMTIVEHDGGNGIRLNQEESLTFVKALCEYATHPVGCVNPERHDKGCCNNPG